MGKLFDYIYIGFFSYWILGTVTAGTFVTITGYLDRVPEAIFYNLVFTLISLYLSLVNRENKYKKNFIIFLCLSVYSFIGMLLVIYFRLF
ncbi:hypothetical protein [Alteribacillus bidgolensis]|uniref:Uncharacterized protein n=1 Tax=Alteribacillus bidgolensis TaxID=930129 RepID=A0A1G8JKX6_9BACI|nr:hypothetical protein [Alteribacillus bidgolensis]SDI31792.1 hypothetical protein SAMN05216352_106236 [Alteribacillus bidgolensis]